MDLGFFKQNAFISLALPHSKQSVSILWLKLIILYFRLNNHNLALVFIESVDGNFLLSKPVLAVDSRLTVDSWLVMFVYDVLVLPRLNGLQLVTGEDLFFLLKLGLSSDVLILVKQMHCAFTWHLFLYPFGYHFSFCGLFHGLAVLRSLCNSVCPSNKAKFLLRVHVGHAFKHVGALALYVASSRKGVLYGICLLSWAVHWASGKVGWF